MSWSASTRRRSYSVISISPYVDKWLRRTGGRELSPSTRSTTGALALVTVRGLRGTESARVLSAGSDEGDMAPQQAPTRRTVEGSARSSIEGRQDPRAREGMRSTLSRARGTQENGTIEPPRVLLRTASWSSSTRRSRNSFCHQCTMLTASASDDRQCLLTSWFELSHTFPWSASV
jgi:hypothetical protein